MRLAILLSSLIVAGCGGTQSVQDDSGNGPTAKNPDQQSFDTNGDKKPDSWKYYRRVSKTGPRTKRI